MESAELEADDEIIIIGWRATWGGKKYGNFIHFAPDGLEDGADAAIRMVRQNMDQSREQILKGD